MKNDKESIILSNIHILNLVPNAIKILVGCRGCRRGWEFEGSGCFEGNIGSVGTAGGCMNEADDGTTVQMDC